MEMNKSTEIVSNILNKLHELLSQSPAVSDKDERSTLS